MFNSVYFGIAIARKASKKPADNRSSASLVQQWAAKCRADLLRTQLIGNMWFFPANTIIFRFVQIQFRGLANAFAVAGWNVYLSIVGNRRTAPSSSASTSATSSGALQAER